MLFNIYHKAISVDIRSKRLFGNNNKDIGKQGIKKGERYCSPFLLSDPFYHFLNCPAGFFLCLALKAGTASRRGTISLFLGGLIFTKPEFSAG